ncbi:MAG: hypothetical protein ACYCPM_04865 [Acidobacteriaceae bacterium]
MKTSFQDVNGDAVRTVSEAGCPANGLATIIFEYPGTLYRVSGV